MKINFRTRVLTTIGLFFIAAIVGNGAFLMAQTTRPLPMPDLIIESITVNPAIPKAGQEFTISAKCKNSGTAKAGTSHLSFRIGGGTPILVQVPSLDAGASMSWEKKIILKVASVYPVFVGADQKNNQVKESSENNNWKNISITIKPADVVSAENIGTGTNVAATPQTGLTLKPDIKILEVSVSPANPYFDQTIDLKIVLKNIGPVDTNWSMMAIRVYGPPLAPIVEKSWEEVLGIFKAGGVKERHLTFSIKDLQTKTGSTWEGKYLIQVKADSKFKVDESNEGNNQMDIFFNVRKN